MTFSDIKGQVKKQQQIIDALGKMLSSYPDASDWVKELLVNHHRPSKTNQKLQLISKSSSISSNYLSWKPDINRETAKEFIRQVHQRIPSQHWMHRDLNVIYEDKLFDNSPQLIILNDWRESTEIDDNHVIEVRLKVNLPPTERRQQLNTNLMADSVYGIWIPFNWGQGFLKFDNNRANITVELLSAYDKHRKYIHYDGVIIEARRCYKLLKTQERSLPWSQRLFKKKLPEFDQWIKQQRQCELNINDDEIYNEIVESKALQKKIKQALEPSCVRIENQFNTVFHEMLNYPTFKFGSCHLKFPRRDM